MTSLRIVFCSCLFFLAATVSPVRAQPTGTLLDSSGNVLRGTPLIISGNDGIRDICNPFATDIATLTKLQELGFNTVRLCLVDPFFEVQTSFNFWTIEQQLPLIDIVIDNAALVGMNVVLNYHSVGEHDGLTNLDMEVANRYWDLLAPRYANEAHVYYEILNEPTFQRDDYLDGRLKTNLTNLYKKVRLLAPQRQILMFSFSGLDFDMQRIIDAYSPDMDWEFTSVAWHAYGADETTLSKIEGLMSQHRMVCTEWDYPGRFSYVPGALDGFEVHAGACERIGCGWMDWRDWDDVTLDEIENQLLPDAILNDYFWATDTDQPTIPDEPATDEPSTGGTDLFVESTNVEVSSGRGKRSNVTATVVIVDAAGNPVEGAAVTIQWGAPLSGTSTATTDATGKASFEQSTRSRTPGQPTATVIDLVPPESSPVPPPVDEPSQDETIDDPEQPSRGRGKGRKK